MSARRRGLIGAATDGWVDTGFDLTNFSGGSSIFTNYNQTSKELLVYSTQNSAYRNVYKSFPWEAGYQYRVVYDLQFFKGNHRSGFAENDNLWNPNSGSFTQSQHVEFTYPTQTHNINYFRLYVTWATPTTGSLVISNFRIYKKPLEV